MDQIAHIKRLEKKIDALMKASEYKPRWVRASVITQLTGWNNQKMHQARKNMLIDWKDENGLWYDLNSVNPLLIKKTA